MSIELLEHIRDELKHSGAIQSGAEFCRAWLGRNESYIRTLRHQGLAPSLPVLAICSSKLGYYADRLRHSDNLQHREWVQLFDELKQLCDSAIDAQAQSIWRTPERMAA